MRAILFIVLLSTLVAAAQTNHYPRLLVGNKLYTDVEIVRVTGEVAVIKYEGGMARIAISNCPPEIQQELLGPAGLRTTKPDRADTAAVRAPGFGNFISANVVCIEGPMAAWTKCRLQVSNRTDMALIARLPESIGQYFANKAVFSNDVVKFAERVQKDADTVEMLRAELPRGGSPKSIGVKLAGLLPALEQDLADKRAKLEQRQTGYRELLSHEPEMTRIKVRQTGQVYESITVWECGK